MSPSWKSELVRLLTSGPGASVGVGTGAILYAGSAPSATTSITTNLAPPSTKICPRGLINFGNMCFANSVLQIVAYCPLFIGCFAKLGKVLEGVGLSGVAGTSGNGTGAEASAYPLVEATVEFMREFVVVDDRPKDLMEKGNANANVDGKITSGLASGSGS